MSAGARRQVYANYVDLTRKAHLKIQDDLKAVFIPEGFASALDYARCRVDAMRISIGAGFVDKNCIMLTFDKDCRIG